MTRVIKGQTLSFAADGEAVHESKGAVAVGDDGAILWAGPRALLPRGFAQAEADDYGEMIVMPGFIDAHIHFPQYRMLAAPGKDLLDWLTRFTFPEESRYADAAHAQAAAKIFLQRLFAHGTTSALAFCSVHKTCADALFAAAQDAGMALVTGKTMMDRNAIPAVEDTPETGARETVALYEKWHGRDRLRYAVTPRFAITSSDAQLKVSGELLASLPGALMQTHLSESPREIAFVKELFPWSKDYTDVYDRFGLLGERSLFAHGIHLSERECGRLSESGSTVVHCPTSNTFLGSGLMSMPRLSERGRPVHLGVATDVGGGVSYSMLATLGEAYKVQMLNGYKPSALGLFHMATRGNAGRLKIAHETGALEQGKFADIVVLDPQATPVLASRHALSSSLEDVLFSLMILGDDRAVKATYVKGRKVHGRA
ncbi:guanine deaminase [Aestuariivirga sp.]|uniref:guanine deaminase n=1 Tax=Aestuariivirga sp. TaxID=2650926 RepID=UPI0025BCB8F9|nr:guanine deaminase [Aestuariivirga sp.]MCA3556501.1 guanine deaminase [Aestuariivirga sp.]